MHHFASFFILCSILLVGCQSVKPTRFCSQEILKSPHQVKSLDVGYEALLTRIHLIRSAENEIAIQTFIWADDEVGVLMFYELLLAAKRGVQVRIIADQMFSMGNVEWLAYATTAHPNLSIRLYNPNSNRLSNSFLGSVTGLAMNFKKYNSRMHNKLFIVDDCAITGGRNIENCYYDYAPTLNFKDRDVIVKGPVVRKMMNSFNDYWNFPLVVPAEKLKDVSKAMQSCNLKGLQTPEEFRITKIFNKIDIDLQNPEIYKRITSFSYRVGQVAFFADPPGKNEASGYNRSSRLNETIVDYLKNADKSIQVQSPYLVMSSRAMNLFSDIRDDNPKIKISFCTNSLAATDSWPTYALFYKQKKQILDDLECNVYEYKPLPGNIKAVMPNYTKPLKDVYYKDAQYLCLHAKTLIIDNEISFIGSYNLDPRSANLNTEVELVVWDKDFAKAVSRNIKEDCRPENSWVSWKKRRMIGLKQVDDIMTSVSGMVQYVTTLDLWPTAHAACFELRENGRITDCHDKDFYKNYKDVGNFPMLSTTNDKVILVNLFRSLGQGLKPLL